MARDGAGTKVARRSVAEKGASGLLDIVWRLQQTWDAAEAGRFGRAENGAERDFKMSITPDTEQQTKLASVPRSSTTS